MDNLNHMIHRQASLAIRMVLRSVVTATVFVACCAWGLPTAQAGYIGSSFFKITESGFDFGWYSFGSGAPTKKGTLDWYINEGKISVVLHGYLHLKGVKDRCGRMRMDLYGGNHVLLTTKFGKHKCVKVKKHRYFIIYFGPSFKSNKMNEVKVSIQRKRADDTWKNVGSKTLKLVKVHHKVKLTEARIDFGGESFAFGAPSNSGEVVWTWKAGKIIPRLKGYLHLNNAEDVCARMRIEYFTLNGGFLKQYMEEKSVHRTMNITDGRST